MLEESIWIFNNLVQKQGYSNLCRRRPNVAQIEFLKDIHPGFYKINLAQTEILNDLNPGRLLLIERCS